MKVIDYLLVVLVFGSLLGAALYGDVIVGGVDKHKPKLTTYSQLDVQAALDTGGLVLGTPKSVLAAVNAPGDVLVGFFGAEDDATPSLYLHPGASPQVTQHYSFVHDAGRIEDVPTVERVVIYSGKGKIQLFGPTIKTDIFATPVMQIKELR